MAMYDRIAGELRTKINQGALQPGTKLPKEQELMAEYGVSLATVRKGLELLEAENLVEKRHGSGTFVREPRTRINRSTERYQWEKDRVRQAEDERKSSGAAEYDSGLKVQDLNFSAEYEHVRAGEDLSEVFGVPLGTEILRRRYITTKHGERSPLGVGISFIPVALIEGNPALLDPANEPWPGGTMHQLSTVGIEVDHIIDEVIARPPTSDEVELLDIRPGAPLMALRKISVDINGVVVEVNDVIWPGDRIKMIYRTQLTRWPE